MYEFKTSKYIDGEGSIMDLNKMERKTREIFHAIHKVQGNEKAIFDRLKDLMSPAYLRENEDFFQEKICLDAGCGSNANASYSMLAHGAAKVHSFDLDESIFETVPRLLKEFDGRYELTIDNVLDMDFSDGFFDFVHCSGVLHHSSDVEAGIRELARVTKKGGMLYVMTYGKGGLIRDITTFLREKYRQEQEFKTMVDALNEEIFEEFFTYIFAIMQEHGDEYGSKVPLDLIRLMFDKDIVLTIKDRITAPVYHENSEAEIIEMLKSSGITKVERLVRYPKMNNIRRFLSPLYYQYESKFSHMLYGSGTVQIKGIK